MDRDPESDGDLVNKPNSEMGSSGLMDMKKCFTMNKNGDSQRKVKTGEKFSCEDCGKTFIKKHNLDIHMRIHTGETFFCCHLCGCRFTDESRLNKHTRIHTGQKPFCCVACGNKFSRKAHLNTHTSIHTGQKPFCCDICGHKFTDQSNRNKHMRIHTRQKILSCDLKQDGNLSVMNSVDTNVLEIESAIKSEDDKLCPLLSQFYQDQNKDRELPEENNGGQSIKIEDHQNGLRSVENQLILICTYEIPSKYGQKFFYLFFLAFSHPFHKYLFFVIPGFYQ
uniref:C2H2-type domain-containing protein n=1 Tax=Xiphophorus maculatus TaxID=8083 RepID=A0A3B5RE90_XIPMA